MICSKAPGKIILFGEHFVVKGVPGIGMAVSSYAKACVEESDKNTVLSKQLGLVYDEAEGVGFGGGFEVIFKLIASMGCSKRVRAYIDSSIFMGSGMGSSAASSVALIHALMRLCGLDPSKEVVSRIAFEAEKAVHGKPSGIDNTLATYGGLLYYRSGVFERIDIKWPEEYSLLVVNTGIHRETGVVVKDVLNLYERRRGVLEHIYKAAEELVNQALAMLKKGDFENLGELMNINQGLLYTVNVSCPKCEEIIWLLRRNKALGVKLSGAGRGGIIIALYRKKDLEGVRQLLKEESLVVSLDEQGVLSIS
ncbi:MAG: mevalonate kinase [Sulfolobales archaeon]